MQRICYLWRMKLKIALIGLALMMAATAAEADPVPEVGVDHTRWRGAIIHIDSEADIEELKESGVVILRRRADLLLAYIPPQTASKLRGSITVEPDRKVRRVKPTLDIAMERFGASRVVSGEGLPAPYRGKGVVVGICDIGFDPLHSAFKALDGTNRVARVVQYKEAQGQRIVVEPDDYADWRTDTTGEYHATHVAAILAGSDNRDGYGGVASESEIVVTLSQESEMALLAGVEDIIEYAHEVGKPAVVNLSMGGYLGPHDGTSLFSQYMDYLGEEALICLSSGNEGCHANTLSFDATDARPDVKVRIGNSQWSQFEMTGATEVWSADNSHLTVALEIWDGNAGAPAVMFEPFSTAEDEVWSVSSYPDASDYNEEFANCYNGRVVLTGGLYPYNGRRYVSVEYDATTDEYKEGEAWSRYELAIRVEAVPGVHADIFADGIYSRLMGYRGYPYPNSDFSVSDLCCGRNVVSVGMYGNRNAAPLLQGGEEETGFVAGEVAPHSGYGTLRDGTVMPITVAPGAALVSAMSTPYMEASPGYIAHITADTPDDYRDHNYWVSMSGTSMSSPYVAGFLATWVEADPTLTVKTVKEIIEKSNIKDYPDPENPRHGKGWFNPYDGIKRVIERAVSVDDVNAAPRILRLSYEHGCLQVCNPLGMEGELRVYSLDGKTALRTPLSGDAQRVELDVLMPGAYVAVAGSCRLKIVK